MRRLMRAALPLVFLFAMPGLAGAQSPSAIPSPSAAPDIPAWASELTDGPGADPLPTGLAWEPASGLLWSDDTHVGDLVAWSGGFALVGSVRTPPRGRLLDGIWHSADGVTWERAPMPDGAQNVAALLPFRGGLVLASRRPGPSLGDSFKLDLWRSEDAVTWRRARSLRGMLPPDLSSPWRIIPKRLFVADGRLVQLALVDWVTGTGGDRSGGPALAMIGDLLAGRRPGPARMIGWTSRDGATWQRRPVRGALVAGSSVRLDLFATTTDGVIARRQAHRMAILESADGLTWSELASQPSGYRWGGNEGLLVVEGAPLLLSEERQAADVSPLAAWMLGDDAGWTKVLGVPEVQLHGAASEGSSLVLAGRTFDRGSEWPWVVVSVDGARTWDRDLSWVGPNRGCVGTVAIANGIVAMIGCELGQPAIWAAPLPALPEVPGPAPSSAPSTSPVPRFPGKRHPVT